MKLIQEISEDVSINVLEESAGNPKSYFIEGIFLQGGIPNRNKRFYSLPVLDTAVEKYTNEYINRDRAVGELGHPSGPTINYDRASHKILSLTKEGNNYVGKAKIMGTPMGNIVKNLIDEGVKVGVSSRGLGSLKLNNQGINEVQSDFFLATAADIVSDPSAPDAFMTAIREGAEWIYENDSWTLRELEETKKIILTTNRALREETALKLMEDLLRAACRSKN